MQTTLASAQDEVLRRRFLGRGFKPGSWNVTLVTPGEEVVMTAPLAGVRERDVAGLGEVKFRVYSAGRRWRDIKEGSPITDSKDAPVEVAAQFDEAQMAAVCKWTPDKEVTSMPAEVVFVPICEGLGTNISEAVKVAQAWVVDSAWVPGSCFVGDKVRVQTEVRGITREGDGAGQVSFAITWHRGDAEVEWATLSGDLTAELTAEAEWTAPTIEEIRAKEEELGDEEEGSDPEDELDLDIPPEALGERRFRPRCFTFRMRMTVGELTDESELHVGEPPFYYSL